MCQSMWGDTAVSWEAQSAVNTAVGLLCLWNDSTFKVDRRICGRGFICLEGTWCNEDQKIYIINIYAPCDPENKRDLWESLKQIKNQNPCNLWCMVGDFNSVRNAAKIVGLS